MKNKIEEQEKNSLFSFINENSSTIQSQKDPCSNEIDSMLDQALKSYEESERSLKLICHSIEQENYQLEKQIQHLEIHRNKLIEEQNLIENKIEFFQNQYQTLIQQIQFHFQFNKQIHQRYEDLRNSIKKILSQSLNNDKYFPNQTFFNLDPKFISLEDQHQINNDHINKGNLLTNDQSTTNIKLNSFSSSINKRKFSSNH